MATVLSSIKDYLAVNDTDAFDQEILMLVHSALSSLDQIGKVTIPSEITNSTTWESICQDGKLRPFVKNYVFCKVRLIFDPPSSSIVADAINKSISESEWRFYYGSEVK